MRVYPVFALLVLLSAAACGDDEGGAVVPGLDAAPRPDSSLPGKEDGSTPPPDAAGPDSSVVDGAGPDSSAVDAGVDASDAGSLDAGVDASDAGVKADAGSLDAGVDASDASVLPDASLPDGAISTCPSPLNGKLAEFDFTVELGNQLSTAASFSASGVTTGPISRAVGLTPELGAGSMNSSVWGMGNTPDPAKYLTFSVTPDPKCLLDLGTLAVNTTSSNTGPTAASVATSSDGFVGMTSVPTNQASVVKLSVAGAVAKVEIRVYGYAASKSGGTMRVQQKLTLSGVLR